MSSLDFLSDLVKDAKQQGADEVKAVTSESASLQVRMRLGTLEKLEREESRALGLTVLIGKRRASVSSSDLSKQGLADLLNRAIQMAKIVPEDPYAGLASPTQIARNFKDLDLYDPYEPSPETLIETALQLEQAALAVKGITNSEGSEAGWGTKTTSIVASNGFSYHYQTSGSSLGVNVLAGDTQTGMVRDGDSAVAVYFSDLRTPANIGLEAANRTIKRLGARQVKTCLVPIIYDRRVASSLLGHFSSAISGTSIARGTSFLLDSLNKPVFSPDVTIIDDPHRLRGFRSCPCDSDGLPNQKNQLIEGGILKRWLLSLSASRQLGLEPNGHGGGITNLYMQNGGLSVAELISDIKEGFYVTELFGQGVNGLNGDYSRGAAGFWIENGQITYPVHEVTIAGNLKEIFKSIIPANDLKLEYGIDSPTLRLAPLTVAGG